jgi:hypothetical protein
VSQPGVGLLPTDARHDLIQRRGRVQSTVHLSMMSLR